MFRLPRIVLVLVLKAPHPGKPLSPLQTGIVGHPSCGHVLILQRRPVWPLPGFSQWLFLHWPHPVCSVAAGGITAVPQRRFCPTSFVVTLMRCHTNLTLVYIHQPTVKLFFYMSVHFKSQDLPMTLSGDLQHTGYSRVAGINPGCALVVFKGSPGGLVVLWPLSHCFGACIGLIELLPVHSRIRENICDMSPCLQVPHEANYLTVFALTNDINK